MVEESSSSHRFLRFPSFVSVFGAEDSAETDASFPFIEDSSDIAFFDGAPCATPWHCLSDRQLRAGAVRPKQAKRILFNPVVLNHISQRKMARTRLLIAFISFVFIILILFVPNSKLSSKFALFSSSISDHFASRHGDPTRLMPDSLARRLGLQLSLRFQCTRLARLGSTSDGGWTVCLDYLQPKIRSHVFASKLAQAIASASSSPSTSDSNAQLFLNDHLPCLVYSFGIADETSFDFAAEAIGCEVFMFDPSIGQPEQDLNENLHFFPIGLSNRNYVIEPRGWRMQTFVFLLHSSF